MEEIVKVDLKKSFFCLWAGKKLWRCFCFSTGVLSRTCRWTAWVFPFLFVKLSLLCDDGCVFPLCRCLLLKKKHHECKCACSFFRG